MTTESDYWYHKANLDRNYGDLQHQSAMNYLVQREEMGLVEILKPKIKKDGDKWYVLYGENIQEGVVGFGDTPYLAILDFNKNFNRN